MSEQNKGKIQALTVQNFTCFEDVSFEFSTGINLFIGENGTGKTHILKLLYAVLSTKKPELYVQTLLDAFKIEGLGDLARKSKIEEDYYSCEIPITFKIKDELYSFYLIEEDAPSLYKSSNKFIYDKNIDVISSMPYIIESHKKIHSDSLFIPCAEMLSLYPGFISAYNKRENSFDETHYDLALALNANPLRNSALHEAEELSDIIEKELNIKVMMENDKFYIVFKNDNNRKVAAPLAAEGIKKLGQMIYLIRNGSLTKDTVLFWDEPEVNLNPKYIRLVADFLMTLARQGVQIFVATHDYLLTHYLSSHAEYQEVTDAPAMKFFSFYKTENGTKIESAATIAGIQNNVLLDEYSALYDLEGSFFNQSIKM